MRRPRAAQPPVRARASVREAIAREPEQQRYYLDSLGRVLSREGRFDEAAQALQGAIALLAPAEATVKAETLVHLAEVRAAQGHPAQADSLRAEAQRLLPR